MNVDGIKNGVVIDHITAGRGMRIYELMGLGELDCPVAIMQRAASRKMGKKDIIKIDGLVDVDLDVIGFVDSGATVNIIRDGELVEKTVIAMPTKLTNVIFCRNPRCITASERGIDHVFRLADEKTMTYRCIYCDSKAK